MIILIIVILILILVVLLLHVPGFVLVCLTGKVLGSKLRKFIIHG